MRIFISGQKHFGGEVLSMCLRLGLEVVGVCCPIADKYIGRLAKINGIPIIISGSLNFDVMPENVDLGITAHSFDYIGKLTRYKPRYGWIGYHPSLLPRHRGRCSIEWAVRMGDPITGGTVFWLNSGIDRGDIALQDFCFIDPKYKNYNPKEAAAEIWRATLSDMGVSLLERVIRDVKNGRINKVKQNNRFSTWEPSTGVNDVYRPDSLMIAQFCTDNDGETA